jgi:glycosyltransferase involved in cell wall biosynthesis
MTLPTKIHIISEFRNTPWGGGNQFLKALRDYLRSQSAYSENINQAEIVIVNGHQFGGHLWQLFYHMRASKNLALIHRVDGPMEVVRGSKENRFVDEAIAQFNKSFATATVFQSSWSRDLCITHGLDPSKPNVVVNNAPDPTIFYPGTLKRGGDRFIKIISTSWSGNWRKGFDIFKYLDEHLDYSRYKFTFVGNSPVVFRNIHHIQPLPSNELADELRKHHIFLQASHLEACSNSLIEAINCGLVPVVRNNSSHPEIVGDSGILYDGIKDIKEAIDSAATRLFGFSAIANQKITMAWVGNAYLNFAKEVSRTPVAPPSLYDYLVTWVNWRRASRLAIFSRLRALISKWQRL